MGHWSYLAVLAFVLLATGWLELVLRTRVYRRWRRLLLCVACVLVPFVAWDAYSIARGQWTFDPARTTGRTVLFDIPVEEIAFFVVIPVAAVLTLEAVRSVRGWPVGDEETDP